MMDFSVLLFVGARLFVQLLNQCSVYLSVVPMSSTRDQHGKVVKLIDRMNRSGAPVRGCFGEQMKMK